MANLGDFGLPNPQSKVLLSQFSSPSTSGLLDALIKIRRLSKHREYFVNQRILLDGVSFEACRFDNCVLVTATGDIHLTNCVIGVGTKLELGGQLVSVAKLLIIFNQFPNDWFPEFTPLGNEVYAISIP